MKDYYVYEWIRLDTNEPFYIGKGKENRCYKLTRGNNQHFNNIVKSIPVAVNILHDNLEEQVAFDLECYYIWLYRDIIGYDLCNMNDGGEGQTLCGKKNGMYGVSLCGELNGMYGKHHTEESNEKNRQAHLGKNCGKDNFMYGKGYLIEGDKHPRATDVICLTTKRIFKTIKDGAKYYNIKNRGNISNCCRGKYNYCGVLPDGTKLVWMYLEDFLNKCEYILL